MSVMRLNISSLLYHNDNVTELLNHNLNVNFQTIGVTENRFIQNETSLNSTDLQNYKEKAIHKGKELESIFAAVLSKPRESII